ncbi:hypothetical protein [Spongiactinospora gelatinilytica]|nr:hypothetical protein [Spongiactinospora gelatinilytica]
MPALERRSASRPRRFGGRGRAVAGSVRAAERPWAAGPNPGRVRHAG